MGSYSEWPFNPFERSSRLKAPKTPQLPPIAHLCDLCAQIFSGETTVRPRFSRPYYHIHQTFEELVDSANGNCRLCSMRLSLLSDAERLYLEGCDRVHFMVYNEKEAEFGGHEWTEGKREEPFCVLKGIDFEYWPKDGSDIVRQSALQVHDLEETRTWMSEIVGREPSNNSQTSKNIAESWLETCRVDHVECRAFPLSGSRPARVLDLGQSHHISPRLCIAESLPPNFKYATLSHEWGKSQLLQLTMASISVMQDGLNISQLSQTFRDAMETTRRLGLQYLWIDSLCIIQDSEADWQEESHKMGDIYQNAEVNIAAARTSGSEGLFSQRAKSEVLPCRIEAKWKNANQGTYFVSSHMDWDLTIKQSPLLSRAWVTQELILARRVLYFADGQMFWECCETQANEVYPKGIPRLANHTMTPMEAFLTPVTRTTGHKLTTISKYSGSRLTLFDETHRPHKEYLLWDHILDQYTAAVLMFPEKDKLVAIASVGNKLPIQDELVAGLWRNRLQYQLLWRIYGSMCASPTPRPTEWQAPSWSWACINRRIDSQVSENRFLWQPPEEQPREERSLIQVVDILMEYKDNTLKRGLAGASLRLWAPII